MPGADGSGKVFRLWAWTLPVLLGLTAGWFGMTCLEVWLDSRNGSSRPFTAASYLTASDQEVDSDSLTAFLRINPFKVTPMEIVLDETVSGDEAVQIVGTLATAVLKGTSPGFMAWMEDEGKLRLVMIGDSFDVYTLEEVTYTDATFVKDENRVLKEINYGKTNTSASSPAASLPDVRLAGTGGGVVPPDPANGTPGAIGRDMVNSLLENPFDELKKVRLRPAEKEQGLQIQWINKDSILAQLGVQKNDVVNSINGIAFRNAMDISNSLNSLMGSDTFDVVVMRNGAPVSLQYVVR